MNSKIIIKSGAALLVIIAGAILWYCYPIIQRLGVPLRDKARDEYVDVRDTSIQGGANRVRSVADAPKTVVSGPARETRRPISSEEDFETRWNEIDESNLSPDDKIRQFSALVYAAAEAGFGEVALEIASAAFGPGLYRSRLINATFRSGGIPLDQIPSLFNRLKYEADRAEAAKGLAARISNASSIAGVESLLNCNSKQVKDAVVEGLGLWAGHLGPGADEAEISVRTSELIRALSTLPLKDQEMTFNQAIRDASFRLNSFGLWNSLVNIDESHIRVDPSTFDRVMLAMVIADRDHALKQMMDNEMEIDLASPISYLGQKDLVWTDNWITENSAKLSTSQLNSALRGLVSSHLEVGGESGIENATKIIDQISDPIAREQALTELNRYKKIKSLKSN